ncbi:MAG: ketol-acid reductoisomerase [Methanomicrobiales archaeon]|nr:ketol-acid reductoisomerase [Methanomicrobiales archaeon]
MTLPRYYEKDADPSLLQSKQITVLGYGSQGRGQALNLRDSGASVHIGVREGPSFDRAIADGFSVYSISEAVLQADIIMVLLPDETHGEVYKAEILPHMKKGATLLFSHGFSICFGQIVPPPDIDVALVAPKGPGIRVRSVYEEGSGLPALIAVHQDKTGKARDIALAYAQAIGATRTVVLETSFREETVTDLFGEQVVLCGGFSSLIKAAFETLVAHGYDPEMAYFEVLHETKLTIDLIYEGGLTKLRRSVSNTAHYGDVTRGPRVISEEAHSAMHEILHEIEDGRFARDWLLENSVNKPVFTARTKADEEHLIEKTGKEVRGLMPTVFK